jgi:hypothetical protein
MNKTNELKKTLNSIMRCMLADYEAEYRALYPTKTEATGFRDNLIKALNGFSSDTIIDGYDKAIESNPDKMPTVADIARGCVSEHTEAPKQTKEPVKKAADTSKKELTTDMAHPLKLLAHAIKTHSTPENEIPEERTERISSIHSTHNDLIISHKALKYIRKPIFNPLSDLTCSSGGCSKGGSRSAGVVGGGKFYCGDHFLQSV